jgi:hypothetical protein
MVIKSCHLGWEDECFGVTFGGRAHRLEDSRRTKPLGLRRASWANVQMTGVQVEEVMFVSNARREAPAPNPEN